MEEHNTRSDATQRGAEQPRQRRTRPLESSHAAQQPAQPDLPAPDIQPAAPVVEELTAEGRARIRSELRAARRRAKRGRTGLVIVHTGAGKGKTTAALGMLLRAWGQGLRVVMLQFLKAQTGNWGEIRAARRMGIEIVPLGAGFTWTSEDLEHDKALAREGWALCRARIESGGYDVVIMDELTYCFTYGWLDLDDVLGVLRSRPPGLHVIITGRDAPEALLTYADLVTEMREVKHPYYAGIQAQKGIEF